DALGGPHVDGFREATVKESCLNVCLVYQPAVNSCYGEQDPVGCRLNYCCEGLFVIDALFLLKASSDEASFVPRHSAIRAVFPLKYKLRCDRLDLLGGW